MGQNMRPTAPILRLQRTTSLGDALRELEQEGMASPNHLIEELGQDYSCV